jgi:hypothetical protein
MICRKQLSTGEELYIMDENRFICKEDYINSKLQGKKKKYHIPEVSFFFCIGQVLDSSTTNNFKSVCNLTGKKLA